jgi:hypothetical protein
MKLGRIRLFQNLRTEIDTELLAYIINYISTTQKYSSHRACAETQYLQQSEPQFQSQPQGVTNES